MDNTPSFTARTLIYARVSTEDQLEKYGIPLQLRACREYAAARGLSISGEITDDGVSGAILSRPGLDQVRRMVAEKQVDIVLAYDVDRLSREVGHLLILKPEIERQSKLEFVMARFEDSPSGRMFFGIRGVISQYEREQMKERTMRGKRERARAGLIVGGRIAYGYDYDKGRLIPIEDQAQVVRNIFAWYENGLSIRAIGRRLREAGVQPSRSGRGWGHSSVRRILCNETYAGVAYYGTLRREGTLLKRQVNPVNRISFPVAAIVSRDQWMRVQARLSLNPSLGRPSGRYLLRGLLYCPCGRRMSGNPCRGYLSYRCNGRDKSRGEEGICHGAIRVGAIDRAVWEAISGVFVDEQQLRSLIADRQKELLAGSVSESSAIPQMRQKLAKLERKERAALTALLDPDLASGRDTIKAEYRKIGQEKSRVEWEIAAAERAAESLGGIDAWLDSTVRLIREYIPTLETTESRQEFLRGLVSRVEWDGAGEVKIGCLFGQELSTTSSRSAQFPPLEVVLNARVA